jgi:hypothetical protein
MLDKSKTVQAGTTQHAAPRLDLQQHLADLEAAGLLTRIDRPINRGQGWALRGEPDLGR